MNLSIKPNEFHEDAVIRGDRQALKALGAVLMALGNSDQLNNLSVFGCFDQDGEQYDIRVELEDEG